MIITGCKCENNSWEFHHKYYLIPSGCYFPREYCIENGLTDILELYNKWKIVYEFICTQCNKKVQIQNSLNNINYDKIN